jgi:hypothetical protein
MYEFPDTLHFALAPFSWKQADLLIVLINSNPNGKNNRNKKH